MRFSRECPKGQVKKIRLKSDDRASSARNTFEGPIIRKTISGLLATLTIDIGVEVTALVTDKTAEELSLDIGTPVCISFKATAVHMIRDPVADE